MVFLKICFFFRFLIQKSQPFQNYHVGYYLLNLDLCNVLPTQAWKFLLCWSIYSYRLSKNVRFQYYIILNIHDIRYKIFIFILVCKIIYIIKSKLCWRRQYFENMVSMLYIHTFHNRIILHTWKIEEKSCRHHCSVLLINLYLLISYEVWVWPLAHTYLSYHQIFQ